MIATTPTGINRPADSEERLTVLNLTPHAITVRLPDGTDRTYPPSGTAARVVMEEYVAFYLHGVIPVIRREPGEVVGLPTDGAPCLVSAMVLDVLRGAGHAALNIYAPDTGPTAIRNEKGHIVAVTRLVAV